MTVITSTTGVWDTIAHQGNATDPPPLTERLTDRANGDTPAYGCQARPEIATQVDKADRVLNVFLQCSETTSAATNGALEDPLMAELEAIVQAGGNADGAKP